MIGELKQGLIIGLAVSVPVGPIALLILRRSIRDGRFSGFVSGLGAATADCLCGAIVALGLSAVVATIQHHATSLRIAAGILLIFLGIHALRAKTPLESKRPVHERTKTRAFFSTCGLTLANPMTLLGMTFVSAAAGVGMKEVTLLNAAFLLTGIFTASALWWLGLSLSAGWLGKRLTAKTLHLINVVAGALLIGVGAYQLLEVLDTHF